MKLLVEKRRKSCRKNFPKNKGDVVINATSKDDCGRSPVFREISLLNELNNKRSMASRLRARQAENPRAEIKYIHPEIFFLGETRLNDSLNWSPMVKKIPPLSQLVQKEDDQGAREFTRRSVNVRRKSAVDDLLTTGPEYFEVPLKRSNSTSSALSNVSYRSILSSRLFGDGGDESLECLSYLEDREREDDSLMDDSEASTRFSQSDAPTPHNRRQSSVGEEVRRYRRGSILSTFGTITSTPIEEISHSGSSEDLSLEDFFPEQRRKSRRHSVLSALSTFSSVSEAIQECNSDDDNEQVLDLNRSSVHSRSDSISIARSIVADSIRELSKLNEMDVRQVNSQEKDNIEQYPSMFQENSNDEGLLIGNMHKSDSSDISLQLEDLAMEQQGSPRSRIRKLGVRRPSILGRKGSYHEKLPNERPVKPNHYYEDPQDQHLDQSSHVSRSDSISRAHSNVTDLKELDEPQYNSNREKSKVKAIYQEKQNINDMLDDDLNRSNSPGIAFEGEDLAKDRQDPQEIQPKQSALYRRMSMIGGASDHGGPLNRRISIMGDRRMSMMGDRRMSMMGAASDHDKTLNDNTLSTSSTHSQATAGNQTYSSAIHRRMSMVNHQKPPKRQSIIELENSASVNSDPARSLTPPRSLSPTYDIKHSAVSKWRSATQKFNKLYVDLQIQSSTWANVLDDSEPNLQP